MLLKSGLLYTRDEVTAELGEDALDFAENSNQLLTSYPDRATLIDLETQIQLFFLPFKFSHESKLKPIDPHLFFISDSQNRVF